MATATPVSAHSSLAAARIKLQATPVRTNITSACTTTPVSARKLGRVLHSDTYSPASLLVSRLGARLMLTNATPPSPKRVHISNELSVQFDLEMEWFKQMHPNTSREKDERGVVKPYTYSVVFNTTATKRHKIVVTKNELIRTETYDKFGPTYSLLRVYYMCKGDTSWNLDLEQIRFLTKNKVGICIPCADFTVLRETLEKILAYIALNH